MAKDLTVIDSTDRTVIVKEATPRFAHLRAREYANSTGHTTIVLKPVAQYERTVKKKRFK